MIRYLEGVAGPEMLYNAALRPPAAQPVVRAKMGSIKGWGDDWWGGIKFFAPYAMGAGAMLAFLFLSKSLFDGGRR